jgi:hypothetical protein
LPSEPELPITPSRVAMHAAMLPWPAATASTQSSGRLLVVFRLSDAQAPDEPPSRDTTCNGCAHVTQRRTSSLHYVELSLSTFRPVEGVAGVPRLLPLPSPPSSQLLSGPEDGRLFVLSGRVCLLYNDVLPETLSSSPRGAQPALATGWRMRRGMYLVFLSRRIRRVGKGHQAGEKASPFVLASAPIAIRPAAAVLRIVGAVSDVEKNWVPFTHNDTLMLSYSLDPHIVLRVPPLTLQAAADAADAVHADEEPAGTPLEAPRLEVVADVAHVTRFATSAGDQSSRTRPSMRGGSPPLRVGDRFVAFMHTVYKRGAKSMYTAAAYTFAAQPPFAIESISQPFIPGGVATPYPIGLAQTDDHRHLLLSYGVSDNDWHVAKLDLAALFTSLVPILTDDQTGSVVHVDDDESSPTRGYDEAAIAGLPRTLHFFRGTPSGVREAVRAAAIAPLSE